AVPGAVAAPTAGLHFDAAMLERLRERGARLAKLTLHVGVGTFQPVRSERVEDHRMHPERYTIPRETMDALRGRRVLAVGTTSLRALETAAQTGELSGETGLFVYPGFRFRVVDRLLTNFHLPRSTLLMLVSAFAGRDRGLRGRTAQGRAFASPINGDRPLLAPEEAMRLQRALDADIAMAFDECTPYPADADQAARSMRLSMRWAERSKRAFDGPNLLFGI